MWNAKQITHWLKSRRQNFIYIIIIIPIRASFIATIFHIFIHIIIWSRFAFWLITLHLDIIIINIFIIKFSIVYLMFSKAFTRCLLLPCWQHYQWYNTQHLLLLLYYLVHRKFLTPNLLENFHLFAAFQIVIML